MEIWRCDLRKGTEERVVRGGGVALSPDGRRMAYETLTKDGDYGPIAILDLRTGSKTLLSVGGSGIAWSPDGRELLYSDAFPEALRLFGLRTKKEAIVGAYPILAPSLGPGRGLWSPDGKLIAYLTQGSEKDRLRYLRWYRSHAGVQSGAVEKEGQRLMQPLDKSATLHLLNVQSGKDEALAGVAGVGESMGCFPAWSPDGRALAITAGSGGRNPRVRIYRVTVATGRAQPLTPGPQDIWPTWSPDGTRLAYTKVRHTGPGGAGNADYHIAVLDLRTHRETVFEGHSLMRPEWSPNSQYLACQAFDLEGSSVWIINTKAGAPKQK